MKISRYYQAESFKVGDVIVLSKENHRHAVQVLRSEIGSSLILFNGDGGEYCAKFVEITKRLSHVEIETFHETQSESALDIALVLAMIKPDKMDFAIQKAVELGVTSIQPVYTDRSVIKLKASRLEKKLAHWQGVIISASEQSGRTHLAKIAAPVDLADWLNFDQNFNQSLDQNNQSQLRIAMLLGEHPNLLRLAKKMTKEIAKLALIIGPEGGFTEEEEQLLLTKNITPVTFGPRVLRAETAAIAAISACQLCWGDL